MILTPPRLLRRVVLVAMVFCVGISGLATGQQPEDAGGPWGAAVDGIACRLTVPPQVVVGQAIPVVIEVKNTSSRKRYIIPSLDPIAVDHLAIEIIGPDGKKLRQSRYSKGSHLSEQSFQPLEPGAVKRFDVADLRSYFHDLQPWDFHMFTSSRKARPVPLGKFTLTCRFRSPKVPDRLFVGERVIEGKAVKEYKAPAPELVAGQWAEEVGSLPTTLELRPLGRDDLIVHEWGVFTVFNDGKYANVNRKEEWGSLPSFFYRQFPKQRLRWMPSAWDKPIVYFYAKPEPLHVNVQVQFSDGAPVVWWPAVASPVDDPTSRTKNPSPFRTLVWDAWIGARVPLPSVAGEAPNPLRSYRPAGYKEEPWHQAKDFPLPAGCWLQDARLPSASQLTVVGDTDDPRVGRRAPGSLDRYETERFLYYDGLVPAPAYLRCERVAAQSVTLRNQATFDLRWVCVVDRRVRERVGFAIVASFPAGATRTIEPKPVAVSDWPNAGVQQVRQVLCTAGLFEAEADALLKIWTQRLLQAEGVTVFHILPAAEYDRMLPLDILPAPAVKPVRVGIALHPRVEIEPDLTARIPTLIRQLDDDRFEQRAAAAKELLEIGPVAIALLRAELQKQPPLEVRTRIEAILERVDAADWLSIPAGPARK